MSTSVSRRPWLRRLWHYRVEVAFMAPLLVYLTAFTLLPVLENIRLSLVNPFNHHFPTWANYLTLGREDSFRAAFFNTLALTGLGLTFELLVGLGLALLLRQPFAFKGVFRTIVLAPMGVPTLVSAVMMVYIFSTQGYLNELLRHLHLVDHPVLWSSGPVLPLFMIVAADMWKVTPVMVLILLAGLESIPGEVYEAAAMDGANAWQVFRHVTWPLLRPFVTIALILRGIDAFRIFELPLVLTGRSTPVLATFAYTEYMQYDNPYTSAAAATLIFLIIVVFILLYLAVAERGEATVR